MRKILLFFIPLFLFMFAFSSPVQAQTLTISPTSGDSNTTFRLIGTGYTARQSYAACAFLPSGGVFVVLAGFGDIQGPNFNISFSGAEAAARGGVNWEVRIFEGDCRGSSYGPTATFSVSTAVRPPGEGDRCDPNLQSDPRFRCPNNAPCTLIGGSTAGPYICRASSSGSTNGNCNDKQVSTALGCVDVESPTGFASWFLKFAIGIGGGIAFLLMLFGVFQIITSAGDPERLKAGKELITSALIGLLMIIFSVFLLQLIGVQILQIPGFGK